MEPGIGNQHYGRYPRSCFARLGTGFAGFCRMPDHTFLRWKKHEIAWASKIEVKLGKCWGYLILFDFWAMLGKITMVAIFILRELPRSRLVKSRQRVSNKELLKLQVNSHRIEGGFRGSFILSPRKRGCILEIPIWHCLHYHLVELAIAEIPKVLCHWSFIPSWLCCTWSTHTGQAARQGKGDGDGWFFLTL